MFKKVNKTISFLPKLKNNLPTASLVTIYKSFINSHLDYEEISYYQTFNNSFHEKLISIQNNVALTIAGAIKGSFTKKNYRELSF